MSEINTASLVEQMHSMIAQAKGVNPVEEAGQDSFSDLFQQALGQVNKTSQSATSLATRFELGDPNVSLADAMIEMQKANLGFQGTLMVRNKVVQAYQDIMAMPV